MPMIDEWNGFAVLLANMIEKYAGELDLDSLPDPVFPEDKITNHNTSIKMFTMKILKRKKQHDTIIVR